MCGTCCRIERDKAFAQRKAERATVRMHLRDKYHLAQVRISLPVNLGGFPLTLHHAEHPPAYGCRAPLDGRDS